MRHFHHTVRDGVQVVAIGVVAITVVDMVSVYTKVRAVLFGEQPCKN